MEHRLCHEMTGHWNRSVEAMPTVGGVEKRETIISETEKTLRNFMPRAAEATIQQVLNDPKRLEKAIRLATTTFNERLSHTAEMFAESLEGPRAAIDPEEEHPEQPGLPANIKKKVLEIIRALQTPLPAPGGKVHPYGSTNGVNFDAIKADRDVLKIFRDETKVSPEVAAALDEIDGALRYLSEQDMREETWAMLEERKNNTADKTINGLGKMTLVLASVVAGVVTGIPAIAKMISQKGKVDMKDIMAPLLCFGVAIPMANPHLGRQLFGSVPGNMREDLQAVIGNKEFRTLCTDYNIEGEAWATVIQKMMKQPEKSRALAAFFKTGHRRPEEEKLTKDTNAYIESVGLEGAEKEMLSSMIADGRFTDLVHILGFVITNDAQKVIGDYVRIGARTYEGQAQTLAQNLREPETR